MSVGDIVTNRLLWVPLLVATAAQLAKVLIYSIKFRRLDLSWLFATGGMPSSHSAAVVSLSMMTGRRTGFDSPLFAIAAFFSLIVMYDAAGIRRAAGKQAAVLNVMLRDLSLGHPITEERLKELLGHTPVEVFVGALIGVGFGLLF